MTKKSKNFFKTFKESKISLINSKQTNPKSKKKSSFTKIKLKKSPMKMNSSKETNMTSSEKINFAKITNSDMKNLSLNKKISETPSKPYGSKNKSSKVLLNPKKST
jgi:hypothetical protein